MEVWKGVEGGEKECSRQLERLPSLRDCKHELGLHESFARVRRQLQVVKARVHGGKRVVKGAAVFEFFELCATAHHGELCPCVCVCVCVCVEKSTRKGKEGGVGKEDHTFGTSPAIGIRGLPLTKARNMLCSRPDISTTTSTNSKTAGLRFVYPWSQTTSAHSCSDVSQMRSVRDQG